MLKLYRIGKKWNSEYSFVCVAESEQDALKMAFNYVSECCDYKEESPERDILESENLSISEFSLDSVLEFRNALY
jgi:hypothetical protein